jgi:hypothetical protein
MKLLSAILSLALTFVQGLGGSASIGGKAGVGGGAVVTSIGVVQHKSTFCSATSCALAFTSNIGSGHLLIYATTSNSTTLNAATDNNSNTIANAATEQFAGPERVDYVSSSNSGATTVTAHCSGCARTYISIWEVSGLAGTLDQTGTGHGVTPLSISTSSATTAANEIVFGYFTDENTNNTLTAGAGFSPSETQNGGSGNEFTLAESEVVSSTGVQTATGTNAGSGSQTEEIVVTFK